MRDEDYELAGRCRLGDRLACQILFERHRGSIHRLAFGFTRNLDDADDLTQEIFMRAFTGIGSFRRESTFRTWIHWRAFRCCLNQGRRCPDGQAEPELIARVPDQNCGPHEIAKRSCTSMLIDRAIDRLPDVLRVAFILVVVDDRSYREAAVVRRAAFSACTGRSDALPFLSADATSGHRSSAQ